MTDLPSKSNDTPIDIKVKYPATGVNFTFRIKPGMLQMALEDACRAREEKPQQLIKDLLESFLIREGYLPEWWMTRKF